MSKKNRIKNKEANLQKRINAASTRISPAARISSKEDMLAATEAVMGMADELTAKGPMTVVAHTCGSGEGCSATCEYRGLFTIGLLTTPEVAQELFSKLDLSSIRNYVAVQQGSAREEVKDLEKRGVSLAKFDGHFLVFMKVLFAHEHNSHLLEEYKMHFVGNNEAKVAA